MATHGFDSSTFRNRTTIRHDGTEFADTPEDSDRRAWGVRQRATTYKAAVVQSRADWQWLKVVLGLCGWAGEGPSRRVCWTMFSMFLLFLLSRSTVNSTNVEVNRIWCPMPTQTYNSTKAACL